jgi:hypothetical protein
VRRPAGSARLGWLRAYYLGTPLFWLLDSLWGVRLRVAFLDDLPVLRDAYYLLCFGIGIVAMRAPRYAGRLAFFESSANLGLLILSVGVWYLRMIDWAGSPDAMVRVVTPWELGNFVLAAGTGAVSYGLRAREVREERSVHGRTHPLGG